ncbi:hypothetical protein BC941DRAFT_420448 [Chlamydoabsidia padenii]|nr:hypothetical protein BC941DRAFT_420448 [Chlamydoabsidia padenii]
MVIDDDFLDGFQTMTSAVRQFPSMELKDIKGNKVDIKKLAHDYRLILITLKNASCMVCPQLLHILNLYGLDPTCTTYQDPFTLEEMEIDEPTKKFFRLILLQDAYFVVLCPGEPAEVADIQYKTHFQYPFIAGDQALSLGKALKMNMSDQDLWPATMEVTKDDLDVSPIYIGRGPGNYYHKYLLKLLVRERGKCEMKGVLAMREAYDTLDRLKRKIIKCEQKSLATWILTTTTRIKPQVNSTDITTSSSSSPSLPPELLEHILSFIEDTAPLVSITRVSRLYFITVCNILIHRLRTRMERLRRALPLGDDGQCLTEETDVFNKFVNRWGDNGQGVGFRDLEQRLDDLLVLVIDIGKWTRCWSPRRKIMSDRTSMPHLRRMRIPLDDGGLARLV